MRTKWWIAFSVVFALMTTSCKDKNRSDNTPVVPKKEVPKKKEKEEVNKPIKVASLLRGKLLVEGKVVTRQWSEGEEVRLYTEEGKEPQVVRYQQPSWRFTTTPEVLPEESCVALYYAPIVDAGTFGLATNGEYSFKATPEKNKRIGNFTISSYYHDVLIGTTKVDRGQIRSTMASPYNTLEVILTNSRWEQELSNIVLTLENVPQEAFYKKGKWEVASLAPLTINYARLKGATTWKSNEADTLRLSLPSLEGIKATLSFTNGNGLQSLTITPQNGSLSFTFPVEEIHNPPLAFDHRINGSYWANANKYWAEEIKNNYGGEFAPKHMWVYGFTELTLGSLGSVSPTRNLYRMEGNKWSIDTTLKNPEEALNSIVEAFAIGLEDLNGNLVEVYPPSKHVAFSFVYTTAPVGEYRVVAFAKWAKGYDPNKKGQWWRLPKFKAWSRWNLKDWRGGYENDPLYGKVLEEEKNPYRDFDRVYVVDRVVENNPTPRWRNYKRFLNIEDYHKGAVRPEGPRGLGVGPYTGWNLMPGEVLGFEVCNTSNQKLRGTIIAKFQYQPFFEENSHWFFEVVRKNKNGKNAELFDTGSRPWIAWSYEVGTTDVVLNPNSTKETLIISKVDTNKIWQKTKGRALLSDCWEQVNFYWRPEGSNEEYLIQYERSDIYHYAETKKDAGYTPVHPWNMIEEMEPIGEWKGERDSDGVR